MLTIYYYGSRAKVDNEKGNHFHLQLTTYNQHFKSYVLIARIEASSPSYLFIILARPVFAVLYRVQTYQLNYVDHGY